MPSRLLETLFHSTTRLYDLTWRDNAGPDMPVEAWWGREVLSAGFELCIDLLSLDAHLELKRFLGRAICLNTRLSDGSQASRSGLVRAAQKLGSDGGFARYRLTVVPWIWLLGRGRHNRVFQDKSVVQIVEAVFADYADVAAWQWTDEVAGFLADTRPRSYCVQYGESDYAFVSRLLAEEGLGWCVDEDRDAPAGHRLRLFADSQRFPEDVVSQSANGGQGIRFHRADSQEEQDAILAFGQQRRLISSVMSAISYDYKAKQSVVLNIPGQRVGSERALLLESYDDPGLYAWANAAEAERYGRLAMETREARQGGWLGRGTVRSLRPGTAFDLIGLPLDPANPKAEHRYTATDITHLGINNLSGEAIAAIAQRLGHDKLIRDGEELATGDVLVPAGAPEQLPPELLQLAAERGYGNTFEAHAANTPWRPQLEDRCGARLNPRPTAPGPMSALVVGPDGQTTANGLDELWCDALGRVKIRFHWQQAEAPDDRDSCWVRVISRQAGAGMGWQWLPRIGQEVLVDFLSGDIDRPVILGALYNGQGEGAHLSNSAPTPGGQPSPADQGDPFAPATDHRPSGQGNLAGGNSPAWHGVARNNHAAALSGFKSKEFGGAGYTQLVMDDTDQQQRLQLKTTQHASELNLGHLIHQADNYRGSFRGTGVELRTDAWGALRAGQGMIMTTWPGTPDQPAGDMAPAMALLKQADTLAHTLNQATATHQTVQLAGSIGTEGKNKSRTDEQAAPLKALHKISSGMVDGKDQDSALNDARQKTITASPDKRPHLTDPAIIQAGKAGIGTIAGQNLQFANGEALILESGEDINLAIAGKARIHAGQAIGLLAGAIAPGDGNTGIKLIAAKDDIDLQAQSDELKFLAKKDIKLVSATQHIDFAAAKKIHLAVAGGASITIDGGITVQCPGTITVHASKKSFSGPESQSYGLPKFPESVCLSCLLASLKSGSPFVAPV
ncbi:type VI secretion system tip protein VgrG [Dechloromonas sp. XY25]|uniref:Type VI secretion system tip protein VgrG n=1 Tax=Dechloromonas hankyongensis TaxID=2908002 RepID=A0ABS9K1J0_9RHOO|nr:type VI secretion system Vgr family protein [Dechloromonas hankyongensis]MCG2577023.1 type VI secretion system tip protein VgrG [Dechloromonas hankyongensis]